MNDLAIAKNRLADANLSLVIAKSGNVIYEAGGRGISDLVRAIQTLGDALSNCSVADIVVGRGAAMLCIYLGAAAVYADMMSEPARSALEEHGIIYEHGRLVPNILNRQQTGICPVEEITSQTSDPKAAYALIVDKLQELAQ